MENLFFILLNSPNNYLTRLIYSVKCKVYFIGVFAVVVLYYAMPQQLFSQSVGINTTGSLPKDAALLEVGEGSPDTKGLLIPRVNLADVSSYPPLTGTAVTSLIVYSTTSPTNGNGPGYYYWSGTKWINIPAPSNGPGNSGQVLSSQGSGNSPQWSTLSGSGCNGCSPCASQWGSYSGATMNWGDCARTCANSTEGTYSDWRMPTMKDAIELAAKEDIGTNTNYFWTATPLGLDGIYMDTGGNNGDFYRFRSSDGYYINTDATAAT